MFSMKLKAFKVVNAFESEGARKGREEEKLAVVSREKNL